MLQPTIESVLNASTIRALHASAGATCEVLDPDTSCGRPVTLTPARRLTPGQVSALKDILLDPQSWLFAKKCRMPRDTALFQMRGNEGEVSVRVGMSCLGWIVNGPAGSQGGFFDPVQNQIRALLKSIFPEYASPSRRSMWRAGVIAQLRAAGYDDNAARGRQE